MASLYRRPFELSLHVLRIPLFLFFFFSTFPLSLCHLPSATLHAAEESPASTAPHHDHMPASFHGKGPAEKLIRALNLMPTEMQLLSSSWSSSKMDLSVPLQEKHVKLKINEAVSTEELGMRAGYFALNHTYSAKMFYFFFESRGSEMDDPLILWMTGGPGCGSELALFHENGPFFLSPNLTLLWNNYGWDQISNIIFVDQPTGTGFSYSIDYRDIRHDEVGFSQDLYDFIQAFLDFHPEYRSRDFFITGESYAGHYIPALASRIQNYNSKGEAPYINLKGIAIGNGLTQPDIQYEAYADYALQMGLIDATAYSRIKKRYVVCKISLSACGRVHFCHKHFMGATRSAYLLVSISVILVDAKARNLRYYDIRKQCEGTLCYDFADVTSFLNSEDVKESLGISEDYKWVACSSSVYDAMVLDWMRNFEKGIPALLNDSIKVLVYVGEFDLVCNWLGNFRWVSAMNGTGQQSFVDENFTSFYVDGEEFASLKSFEPLAFIKMHNAGHMVPMDQPKAALEMMRRWTRGLSLEDGSCEDSLLMHNSGERKRISIKAEWKV